MAGRKIRATRVTFSTSCSRCADGGENGKVKLEGGKVKGMPARVCARWLAAAWPETHVRDGERTCSTPKERTFFKKDVLFKKRSSSRQKERSFREKDVQSGRKNVLFEKRSSFFGKGAPFAEKEHLFARRRIFWPGAASFAPALLQSAKTRCRPGKVGPFPQDVEPTYVMAIFYLIV